MEQATTRLCHVGPSREAKLLEEVAMELDAELEKESHVRAFVEKAT